MRVLFCGSRNWYNHSQIWKHLREFEPETTTIVHGDAIGADRIAARLAEYLGFHIEPHRAEWEKYGRSAGYMRNKEMIESPVDEVIAFQKGETPGTSLTIGLANERNIKVTIIRA